MLSWPRIRHKIDCLTLFEMQRGIKKFLISGKKRKVRLTKQSKWGNHKNQKMEKEYVDIVKERVKIKKKK